MAVTLNSVPSSGGTTYSIFADPNASTRYCFVWIGSKSASSITLTDALAQQAGVFVFYPNADNDQIATLVEQQVYPTWLNQQYGDTSTIRAAWYEDDLFTLNSALYCNSAGTSTAGEGFSFGQLRIVKLDGGKLKLSKKGKKLKLTSVTAQLIPDQFKAISDSANAAITIESNLDILLTGSNAGQLRFDLSLNQQALTDLNEGFHYFYFDENSEVVAQQYPAINLGDNSLAVEARLYPCQFVPGQDQFLITSNSSSIGSYLTSNTGNALQLQPVAAKEAGLALMPCPKGQQTKGRYALTITGEYYLVEHTVYDTTTTQLLCGLNGAETIQVNLYDGTSGDVLNFSTNSALASVFPLNTNGPATPSLIGGPGGNTFRTSWLSLSNGTTTTSISYFNQPVASSLYQLTSSQQTNQILEPAQVMAGSTNLFGSDKSFPFVPYSAATTSSENAAMLATFEREIISPLRKSIIVSPTAIADFDQAFTSQSFAPAATPQGYLVDVATDGDLSRWSEITFAHSEDSEKISVPLGIHNPDGHVQGAFQTSNQFLVVSGSGAFGNLYDQDGTGSGMVFQNEAYIADWPFHVNLGENHFGSYSNVMIFKFCEGSVTDLVSDTGKWTHAFDLNDGGAPGIAELSRWLQNYCAEVVTEVNSAPAGTKSPFADIHTILTNPSWSGILALNCDIGLQDFPEDLKGLLGGIDVNLFKAHHYGISLNHAHASGAEIEHTKSSMFGLINYIDPQYTKGEQPLGPTKTNYDFKVLKLQVLFKNSGIANFECKLQLTMNELFGSPIIKGVGSLADPDDKWYNTVMLDGHYENHNGQNTYVFNESNDKIFTLDSMVLPTIDIEKVQFKTTSTKQSSQEVKSLFSIWGNLNYAELAGMDAFSFSALNFSNMEIEMDFNITDPSARQFTFVASGMTFDLSASTARAHSFAANFPLKLDNLLVGSGKMPTDIGYADVSTPLTGGMSLGQEWYALNFNLNMGTLGNLASIHGLDAALLVAWSPTLQNSTGQYATEIFLRMPGSHGGTNLLKLEGIMKLTTQDIILQCNTSASGDKAYVMLLSDIALELLGIKFPPGSGTNMMLFGNPSQHGALAQDAKQSSLGWYASYVKPKSS